MRVPSAWIYRMQTLHVRRDGVITSRVNQRCRRADLSWRVSEIYSDKYL